MEGGYTPFRRMLAEAMFCAMNETRRVVLASQVQAATSLWSRCVGLLGRAFLRPEEGLWLSPCRSIHTFFMRFPIDALFLDGRGVVLAKATLSPWRFSHWERNASGVLELAAGTLSRMGTEIGDHISLKER